MIVELKLKYGKDTYKLVPSAYGNGTLALMGVTPDGERDVLSLNLEEYGLVPTSRRQFFVGDYSEHEGKAKALVMAGVAKKITKVYFGPFNTRGYLMELLPTVLPEVR